MSCQDHRSQNLNKFEFCGKMRLFRFIFSLNFDISASLRTFSAFCTYITYSFFLLRAVFRFSGFPLNKLQSRVLHLHVYDYDRLDRSIQIKSSRLNWMFARFSRDDSIGEIHLPLCQVIPHSSATFRIKEDGGESFRLLSCTLYLV